MEKDSDAVRVPLFDGSNYPSWKFRMLVLLEEHEMTECIEEEVADVERLQVNAADNESVKATKLVALEARRKKDRKCKSILISRISDSQLEYVQDQPTPRQIWLALQRVFERRSIASRLHLKKKMLTLRHEGGDLQEHFLKFDRLVREYKSTGAVIEDIDVVCHLLITLGPEFATVVTAIETMPEDKLTIEFVKCRLLDEEIKCRGKEFDSFGVKREPSAFAGKPTGAVRKWKCFSCQKVGHKAAECPERQKRKKEDNKKSSANVSEEKAGGICFAASGGVVREEKVLWIADSGASEHMSNNKNLFEELVPLKDPVEIAVALNGKSAIAKCSGKIKMIAVSGSKKRECTLENVLYAPDLRCNLFSIRKVEMAGMEIVFKDGSVKVRKDSEVVACGRRRGLQYEMDFYAESTSASSLYSCGKLQKCNELWHRRYGHLSEKNLELIVKKNMVTGFEKCAVDDNGEMFCEPCIEAKQTRKPFVSSSEKRASRVLELIHTDVCGPVTPVGHDGSRYYVSFIDDWSRFTIVYTIQSKDQVLGCFKLYEAMVTAKFGRKIARVRSDNGGEYRNEQFEKFCQQKGIQMECTVPYSPEQNGISERMNRTLVEKARSMLIGSGVDKVFWCEAVETAAYLVNRSPASALKEDDAMESCGYLRFTDESMKSNFLQSLSTMRRHRLFCDVILLVGSTEIHAHRNVLACVSPHLMELFSSDVGNLNVSTNETGKIPCYRLNGHITTQGLKCLVEYAYTGSLELPNDMIRDVYLAAWQLKIDTVVKECARYMVNDLEPETCIDTRSLPGINRNKSFVQEVDAYIAKNFTEIALQPSFLQLPCILIEVLYQTKLEMSLVTETSLSRLVVDWIRRQMTEEGNTVPNLMERSHMLYLALDNSLQDCSDLPPGQESESDLVQDYKRLVLKCPSNKKHRKGLKTAGRPRVILYNMDIGECDEDTSKDCEWTLIATSKLADHTFISLITLDGNLTRLSIQLRLNAPTTPSPINTPDTISSSVSKEEDLDESVKPELFCEVATMSGPKCGLGVAELEGKLFVCGGYDRAECLRSVESYCPDTNSWTQENNMGEARGRVQIAVIDGAVYAVGGCNGTTELDTVECLSKIDKKWAKVCRLPLARSSAGVCALDGNIYCVGGWNGQSGIRQCDVLKPEENKWYSIAPLNTGRYQAGVASYRGSLWVAGGSDAWNCLGSVERYDLASDQWTYAPSLLTPRRGCGLAEFNGKLYAVGGSDGSHSLNSTECYDEVNKCWVAGPNLTSPRSNVSVAVVQNRLYAIGGFSGKTFLNTIEYLDATSNEWTTFVQQSNPNIDNLLQTSLRNGIGCRASSSSTSSSPDNLSSQNGGNEHTFKPIQTAQVNEYNLEKSKSVSTSDKEVSQILAGSECLGLKKLAIDDEDSEDDGKTNGTNNTNDSSIKLQKILAKNCAELATGNGHSS